MEGDERVVWYGKDLGMGEVNSTFYSGPDTRRVERWCATTADDFIFDVKLHQLFSFHSTPRKLLPQELQRLVPTDAKGKVSASPTLRQALLQFFLRPMSILSAA